MAVGWPLVGRDEEMAAIDRATRRGSGSRGIVLAGAAGVGKTRLAREAVLRAQAHGGHARWIGATASSRPLPLGALALAIGDVGGDPTGVLQRAADALLMDRGSSESLIVVDDAHFLDDMSASLMHQLVAQGLATVILTVRSGEPAPGAVEAIWKDRFLDRVEVQALSPAEIMRLLEAALGGPVEQQSASRLYDLCAGNVLYLRHVVAGELAAGHLSDDSGLWRWDGNLAITPELADLVGRRLVALRGEVADLLDALALAGPLDAAAVARFAPLPAVEEAESLGLVRSGGEGGARMLRLDHPLYGEVRLAQVGDLRARRLRGVIAQALAELDDDSPASVLRRAVLTLGSSLPADPALLVPAAQAALRLFDWQLARRLASAAVEAGGGFEALLALSYALGFGLDPAAADQVLARLMESADGDLQLLQVGVPRAGHLYYMQGRVAEAVQVLDQVKRSLRVPALGILVDGMLAMFAAMSGDAGTSLRLADGVLSASPLPPQVELAVCWARAVALAATGRAGDLGEREARAHRAAARSYDSSLPSLGYAEMHVRALRLPGRIHEAREVASGFRRDIHDLTNVHALAAESVPAVADLAEGNVRSAREVAARCLAGMRGRDTSGWVYVTAMALASACALAGDGPAARAAAEVMDAGRHPGFAWIEPDRLLAWAWVEAAEGAVTGAIGWAHQAAEVAAARGHWGYEAYALASAVRLGDATVHPRLRELAQCVDGPRVTAAALQAEALAAGDGARLAEAAGLFEEMGDLLSAADAAAQAAGCFGDRDRLGRQGALARARRLQAACQGALTPALAVNLLPLPLTGREREIVTLAGSGLTNREIADRLVVSIRTIEGHLYRAAAKLGTSDRRRFQSILRGE